MGAVLRVAIGIMVHNEAENLGDLLESILEVDPPRNCALATVLVVLSGCDDGSVEIARGYAERHEVLRLEEEPVRRGKSAAVGLFVGEAPEDCDVLVLLSGDVLPAPGAIDSLVAPFSDPEVGMTGGRPMPAHTPEGWVDRIVCLQWELHDAMARRAPKLGEMVAFRRDTPPPPPESAVDEASLEWNVLRSGRRLVYVPEAVVYNRGPRTVRDFVAQRRRIRAGHLWLQRDTGYRVSTYAVGPALRLALGRALRGPRELAVLPAAALLEAWARTLGSADLLLKGRNPTVWPSIPSARGKLDVDRS